MSDKKPDNFSKDHLKLKKSRGAQSNIHNPFLKQKTVYEFPEGLDEEHVEAKRLIKVHKDYPRKVVNKVDSPDVPLNWSINPYQGCEHGCVYCYARNTHTYWGFSAGLDFEQQIMAKPNAPQLLRKFLSRKNHVPEAISLSGNTDCYQPLEKSMKITRQLLSVFLEFNHPVGIITKNSLILRDLDLLIPLANKNLVSVMVSITTMYNDLRRAMEPRTSTTANRLKTIETLSQNGIPVGVMVAPIIPGLTSEEIPEILKASAQAGAIEAGCTMLRLNGQIAEIFVEWISGFAPNKKEKILHQIGQVHGGKLNDSEIGRRMRGEGPIADAIHQLFKTMKKKYFGENKFPPFNYSHFKIPEPNTDQLRLF